MEPRFVVMRGLLANEKACGRRVGKVYLPNWGRYFGCRHCYGLTYASCQKSHKDDAFLRRMGAEMGLSAREAAKLLG
jgi:hypothetical protein